MYECTNTIYKDEVTRLKTTCCIKYNSGSGNVLQLPYVTDKKRSRCKTNPNNVIPNYPESPAAGCGDGVEVELDDDESWVKNTASNTIATIKSKIRTQTIPTQCTLLLFFSTGALGSTRRYPDSTWLAPAAVITFGFSSCGAGSVFLSLVPFSAVASSASNAGFVTPSSAIVYVVVYGILQVDTVCCSGVVCLYSQVVCGVDLNSIGMAVWIQQLIGIIIKLFC